MWIMGVLVGPKVCMAYCSMGGLVSYITRSVAEVSKSYREKK